MNSLVFGGSAGVGRALSRALVTRGDHLVIVSRNSADLVAEGAHCRLLGGTRVEWIAADASDPLALRASLDHYLAGGDRRFDNLFFPVGGASDSDTTASADQDIIRTLHTNLTSIMVTINALLPHMPADGRKNIVGFGSISALRGRSTNVAYAAAKRALESYFESLRHSLVGRGFSVQFYRLGYIQTQQSFGKSLLLPAIPPESVARQVIGNLNRDIGIRSLPRFWAFLGVLIKHLPWRIFRRLKH